MQVRRYAAGATIQVVLFGLLAIEIKRKAPTAHTVLEIINARWGRRAHITFLVFCLMTNVIVRPSPFTGCSPAQRISSIWLSAEIKACTHILESSLSSAPSPMSIGCSLPCKALPASHLHALLAGPDCEPHRALIHTFKFHLVC